MNNEHSEHTHSNGTWLAPSTNTHAPLWMMVSRHHQHQQHGIKSKCTTKNERKKWNEKNTEKVEIERAHQTARSTLVYHNRNVIFPFQKRYPRHHAMHIILAEWAYKRSLAIAIHSTSTHILTARRPNHALLPSSVLCGMCVCVCSVHITSHCAVLAIHARFTVIPYNVRM